MNEKDLQQIIEKIREEVKKEKNDGRVASYIPELAKADRLDLGICLIMPDKKVYKCGEFDKLFTMQSISKVISLVMALELFGKQEVFNRVGVEPTGDTFNSMIRLETQTHIPFNPMINAGAISVAGMLEKKVEFNSFLEFVKKLCGREDIFVNQDVYRSEKETGMKNRAIAYLLLNDGVLQGDVEKILDFYFKMCSVNVDTVDLARIGSVLANDGIDVFSGERIINKGNAIIAKTLMFTCGLYDGSGEFALNVGIPAKSGVGGGIMASADGGLGIGVFAPALDAKGNSVWGIRVLEKLSKSLSLHSFSLSKRN